MLDFQIIPFEKVAPKGHAGFDDRLGGWAHLDVNDSPVIKPWDMFLSVKNKTSQWGVGKGLIILTQLETRSTALQYYSI
jgi:hypothetical protein